MKRLAGRCLLLIGAGLFTLLAFIHVTGADTAPAMRIIPAMTLSTFCMMAGLIAINVALSAQKWRWIETLQSEQPVVLLRTGILLTALGNALGQFLPAPIAVSAARSIGGRVLTGTPIGRTVAATLLEQVFDLAIAVLFGGVSLVVIASGDTRWWYFTCLVVLAGAISGSAQVFRYLESWAYRMERTSHRIGMAASRLLKMLRIPPKLSVQLILVSAVRFVVLCLMAAWTTQAAGLDIPVTKLAIALPLVVLVSTIPLTPAALGVNELAFSTVLLVLGVELNTAVTWTLVNRVLVAVGSLIVGALALIVLILTHRVSMPKGLRNR